jgi:hypothetical protein
MFDGQTYVDDGANNRIASRIRDRRNTIGYKVDGPCFGLFVDIEDTIYCSEKYKHIVRKKSLKDTTNTKKSWKPAAGTGKPMSEDDTLYGPHGIFVDTNLGLYVADSQNNRIQLFIPGRSGKTVVNSTIAIDGHKLKNPTNIILDADNNLYILDSGNHRIVFVASKFTQYRCLVACSGQSGSHSASLHNPMSISFDRFGNIFVSDSDNFRVQKFILTTKYCGELNKY